ncbi:hypothetical protein QQG74_17315 [Micromonospora sp. FIMYZ51]|uniref:hypothetical protein n=1 Tax=Micromonospora sp. FIMYZ51 TaxID=3051832 RepID=UPI00311E03E2
MADRRAGLLAVAVVLALAGCTNDTSDNGQPTGGTAHVSPAPVRTDREPIAKRFPHLGDFAEVHWQASTAGTDNSRVPGPTDTRIEAIVALRPDALVAAVKQYDWSPAPAGWDEPLSAELRPFLPTDGTWQVSEQYTDDVRTASYSGLVYLDTTSGTVYLRLIDS